MMMMMMMMRQINSAASKHKSNVSNLSKKKQEKLKLNAQSKENVQESEHVRMRKNGFGYVLC